MYQGSFGSLDCRMSYSSVMRRLTKLAFRLNACIFIVEIVQKVTRSHGPLHITESFLMTGFCLRLICMLFGMSLQGLLSPRFRMHFKFLPLFDVTFLNMFQQSLQISLQRLCVSASYDAIQFLQIFLGKK